jgi:hypothetical protein
MKSLNIAKQMKAGNRIGRRRKEICKGANEWFVFWDVQAYTHDVNGKGPLKRRRQRRRVRF